MNREKAISYLGHGLSQVLVSQILGVSESYIAQFLSEPGVAEQVSALKAAKFDAISKRDQGYDDVEDVLLARMRVVAPMLSRPSDISVALRTINGARRRSQELVSPSSQSENVSSVVVLNMPILAVNTFSLNKENEIVAINEKPLAAMASSLLMQKLSEAKDVSKEGTHQLSMQETENEPRDRIESDAEGNGKTKSIRADIEGRLLTEDSV